MSNRVDITEEAKLVIDQLRSDVGPLMFHQSGGCCDGSSPMCYADGEFLVGQRDVKLGTIHECGFYMSGEQFELWKNTHLTVDVVKGRGSSFSLEIPLGVRFIIRSRLFTDEETASLKPCKIGSDL